MKYKNRLAIPIKLEKEKKEKIDEMIKKINNEMKKITDVIKKDEYTKRKNMEDLIEGKSDSFIFFGYQMDAYELEQEERKIFLLEKEKRELMKEQEKIKKKIERMEEESEKRYREYVKEKTRKEEKQNEDLKMMKKGKGALEDAEY